MFKKATKTNECECLKLIAMLRLREVQNANIAKACGVTKEVVIAQAQKVFGDST